MAERTLLCEIVTPERIVYGHEARMVVAPTIDGEVGILPLHAPLVSVLQPGEVLVRYASGGEAEWFAISGGYIQVHEDKVIILADDAVPASAIDLDRARVGAEHAQQRLREIADGDTAEADKCMRDLKWCEVQIKVGAKKR